MLLEPGPQTADADFRVESFVALGLKSFETPGKTLTSMEIWDASSSGNKKGP